MSTLISTYRQKLYHIKQIVYQPDPTNIMNPYINFYEILKSEMEKFNLIDSHIEFNRNLGHPLLILPFNSEELSLKIND
jgi:hypothetical protein